MIQKRDINVIALGCKCGIEASNLSDSKKEMGKLAIDLLSETIKLAITSPVFFKDSAISFPLWYLKFVKDSAKECHLCRVTYFLIPIENGGMYEFLFVQGENKEDFFKRTGFCMIGDSAKLLPAYADYAEKYGIILYEASDLFDKIT